MRPVINHAPAAVMAPSASRTIASESPRPTPVFRLKKRLKPRSRIETSTPAKTSINKQAAYHTNNIPSRTPAAAKAAVRARRANDKDAACRLTSYSDATSVGITHDPQSDATRRGGDCLLSASFSFTFTEGH